MFTSATGPPQYDSIGIVPMSFDSTCISPPHGEWTAFSSCQEQGLNISPYLLISNPLKESEYCRQYENYPSSRPRRDSARETSIPVEQIGSEVLWTNQYPEHVHNLKQYPLSHTETQQTLPENHGVRKDVAGSLVKAQDTNQQLVVKSELRKRKRGRPRLYPPAVDLHDSDSSPTHSSVSRESLLEKNRVAAEKCRQRRKKYTATLTADVSVLASKNQTLKADETVLHEQILSLKNEVLRHAARGSWAIDRYIARSAGNLCGVEPPSTIPRPKTHSTQSQQVITCVDLTEEPLGEIETGSSSSTVGSVDLQDHDNIWLLNDYVNIDIP